MRFAYKNLPTENGPDDWAAILQVQISNPAKHSPPCRKFEAIIDSGASFCVFHSSVGESIGLSIEKGKPDKTMGVSGQTTDLFIHMVSLHLLGSILRIKAGFTPHLPVAGLLGRSGFFDNFKITFDHSAMPPGFDLERIYRA